MKISKTKLFTSFTKKSYVFILKLHLKRETDFANTKFLLGTTNPWNSISSRISVLVLYASLFPFQIKKKINPPNLLRIIGEIQLILWMYWFGGLRMMAGRNLCRRLIFKTPPIEVRELLSVILFIFFRIIMIWTHNIFRWLHLRSLWFWGPNEEEYTVCLAQLNKHRYVN